MNHHKRLSVMAAVAAMSFSSLLTHHASAQEAPAEPAPPAAAAADAEEEASIPGWFRLDVDSLGPQFWAGATHSLGGLDIASDIYVSGSNGEFDIGPVFSAGDLTLTPMLGVNFNFATQVVNPFIPQLFTIYNGDPIYFESWIQAFINDGVFHSEGPNTLYTRNFLLFKVSEDVGIGPQVEATIALNDAAKVVPVDDAGVPTGEGESLVSLPVGPAMSLAYGKGATLLLFLGYETQEHAQADGGDKITGRFTWIYTF